MRKEQNTIEAIASATATTTYVFDAAGRDKISFTLKRSNHSAGSSVFSVEGSPDNSNFVTFNGLVSNVTNTNAQTITRVASVTLSSDTTVVVALDLDYFAFKFIKISMTRVTDGTNSVWITSED